jgi:hypothetical protein
MISPPWTKGLGMDELTSPVPPFILSENPMPFSQFIRIPRQKQTFIAAISHEKLDGSRQTVDGGKKK